VRQLEEQVLSSFAATPTAPDVRSDQFSVMATVAGATLWGVSGTAAQALFERFQFPVLGLTTVRMLVGAFLIFAVAPRAPRPRFSTPFLALALGGLAGSQITYLEAIQYSNAVTATLLQFLFLPMVAAYEVAHGTIRWSGRWTATLALAGGGTFFLIAKIGSGSFGILVTPLGILFGLLAAVAGALYSILGARFVRESGPWAVTGWGFLLGGLVTLPVGVYSFVNYSLPPSPSGRLEVVLLVAVVIVCGTALAYGLYLIGLRSLPASEVGVVAAFEPIAAAVATYLFLGLVLTATQYLGGGAIVLAVALLGLRRGPPKPPPPPTQSGAGG
jgi:drug/metabolite transporter (DMT)-like permease